MIFPRISQIKHVLAAVTVVTFIVAAAAGSGFTYFILSERLIPLSLSGGSEDRAANDINDLTDYVIYEKRDIVSRRPNGHSIRQISGYALSTDGERHLIYSFADDPSKRVSSRRYLIPTSHISANGYIMLTGVGDENVTVLSIRGENHTGEYRALTRTRDIVTNFSTSEDWQRMVFITDGTLMLSEQGENKKSQKLADSIDFGGAIVAGQSSESQITYIKTDTNIFRINTDERRIYEYRATDGALKGTITLCPQENYGIFISTAVDPTNNSTISPYNIRLLNLRDDTVKTFWESKKTFPENLLISCASGKIVFRDGQSWRMLNTDGVSYRHTLKPNENLAAFTNQGKFLVIERDGGFFIKNHKSGREISIGISDNGTEYGIIGTVSTRT